LGAGKMSRPPFGSERQKETCSGCNETVWLPPGLWYRGEPYHKGCAMIRSQDDYDEEVYEPYMDQVEDELEEKLENMGPMSEG